MKDKTSDKDLFSIGSIAKSFGVSDNTIRRMEAAGLLKPAVIKDSGYRYYDYDNIARIKLILSLRSFGLVYKDMEEFFRDPQDYNLIYRKLFERKMLLDMLMEKARLYLRPENPEEIFVFAHEEMCFYVKRVALEEGNTLNLLDQCASEAYQEAIAGKYPVDYTKPITIFTDCMGYDRYNPYAQQKLSFGVPLREKVDRPGLYVIPPREFVSFAWYSGLSFADMIQRLRAYMDEHHLKQCAPLAASFELGNYVNREIEWENYLFHFMIPITREDAPGEQR